MLTEDLQTQWERKSPELRARMIAILVEMLLRLWNQEREAQHERAGA